PQKAGRDVKNSQLRSFVLYWSDPPCKTTSNALVPAPVTMQVRRTRQPKPVQKTPGDAPADRGHSPAMTSITEGHLGAALAACARVMRPVVRLALAFGVKHSNLEQLLRDLLLDEARKAWLAQGVEPNVSQLSVTTGLNRKAVTAKLRGEEGDVLPHTEMSAAAKTLTLWLEMA